MLIAIRFFRFYKEATEVKMQYKSLSSEPWKGFTAPDNSDIVFGIRIFKFVPAQLPQIIFPAKVTTHPGPGCTIT
jgi:hypothetical protein